MSLHFLFLIPLVALLVLSVHGDLSKHRIRNVWTLGGALLALLLHLSAGGLHGLQVSLLGLGTGLALFLPLYLLGGMAAGDVKLVAAVGALTGPQIALGAAIFSLIAGGVLAVVYLMQRGEIGSWLRRCNLAILQLWFARHHHGAPVSPADQVVAGQRFPYALAIASGALLAVALLADQAPHYMQSAW